MSVDIYLYPHVTCVLLQNRQPDFRKNAIFARFLLSGTRKPKNQANKTKSAKNQAKN